MSKKDPVNKIPILFRVATDASIVSPHGAFGGVGPRGDVVAHFYVDTWQAPDNLALEIHPEGLVAEQPVGTPVQRLERTVVTRMILDPMTALSIAEWLERNAKKALQQAGISPDEADQQMKDTN